MINLKNGGDFYFPIIVVFAISSANAEVDLAKSDDEFSKIDKKISLDLEKRVLEKKKNISAIEVNPSSAPKIYGIGLYNLLNGKKGTKSFGKAIVSMNSKSVSKDLITFSNI